MLLKPLISGDGTGHLTRKVTMATDRRRELWVAQTALPLPCFFPSVSSVKTNLMAVDYVELLAAAGHSLFLVSAYDIAHCADNEQLRIDNALRQSKERGTVILMDSGNYESFWKDDRDWQQDRFHEIAGSSHHHLCFCYDNQRPPETSDSIAEDVVARVIRDQEHALGTVAPIVHGHTKLLPDAVRRTAEQLYPLFIAVPERELGEGILERTRTVSKIREALNSLDVYFPLHLLGTGNPLSIIAYAMAGADSFDGLEWCQTVVDHQTGRLLHFQQWDLIRHQTDWGQCNILSYIQSVLMHNLEFYREFMARLHEVIHHGDAESLLREYTTAEQAALLIQASGKDK